MQANLLYSDEPTLKVETFKVVAGPENDPNWVFGAFIHEEDVASVLNSISQKEKYETVVILAPTEHTTDTHKIFTYSHPGVLENVTIDTDTVQKMVDANIVVSLGKIEEQSTWNGPLLKTLALHFPDAEFVLLSINKDLSNAQTSGYALKSHIPEESIVFAVAEFQEGPNALISDFQKDFTHEVITQFDENRFKDLPATETKTLEILGRYLRLRGAAKPQLLERNQALFYGGESEQKESTVYLVAFGDMMMGRFVRTLMDANSLDYPFEKMDEEYLRVNDILLANLEGPVTTKAVRTSSGMNFGFFPDTAPLLKKYHFDILSQANNHAFDKTSKGYEESLKFLKNQGIVTFGNAREVTHESTKYLHVRGQKFAFLGIEGVNNPIDDEKTLEAIKTAAAKGYKVIVFPHWGYEYKHTPNKRQQELAHAWIDAGAYAVIGHHPHVIQTYETYKNRPIIYSLGNAIFDQYWSTPTQKGLSVALAMNDNAITIYFLPINLPNSQMQLMSDDEAKKQREQMAQWGNNSEDEKESIIRGKLTLSLKDS